MNVGESSVHYNGRCNFQGNGGMVSGVVHYGLGKARKGHRTTAKVGNQAAHHEAGREKVPGT